MSRNGSGGYNLPTNSWNPAVNGVSATPADWQNLINDVATAIQQSVSADGQTPITGNINMNNNKFTGLAAGSAIGQSVRWEQLFSQGVEQDIASAATTDIGLQNTNFLRVTGATTITSFGTNYNGPRFIRFSGVLTLTHSANLLLPYSSNITTAVGDCLIAIPKSTAGTPDGWQVVAFQFANAADFRTKIDVYSKTESSALSGLRNRIVNGDFAVDQEFAGASTAFTAGAAGGKYAVDGWYAYCTGANVTGQQIIVNGRKRYRFTGAASNTSVGFVTRMEAADTADMATKFATISVLLSSSSITTVNWGLYYANTTDSFGNVASPTRTTIQTGSFTINSTEAAYSAITSAALASGAITGLELVFTVGALTAGNTLTFGDAQLERGSIPSPSFEIVSMDSKIARCQRYSFFGSILSYLTPIPSATNITIILPQNTKMRIAPLIPALTNIVSNEGTTYSATSNTTHAQVVWTCPTPGTAAISFDYSLLSRL